MADKKQAAEAKLTAVSIREMSQEDRSALLTEKQQDLLTLRQSLKANELANPKKIKDVRRDIALIKTIENEFALSAEVVTETQEGKEK